MIHDLKPYSEYKDSGVPWLGQVPEHWEVKRNKLFMKEINERSEDGSEELLTVSQYTGVTRRREKLLEEGGLLTNAASLVGYKHVMPNDLVMNIMLAWNGSLGVSPIEGIVSPAYCVYRSDSSIEPRYLHYLFRTPLYTGLFKTESTGVVDSRLRLYPEVFFRLQSLIPPLSEQSAIVRYLDYMDRRIRHYIHTKQKLIKLLEEQKQAIIHRAVTRGLDPNVKLKPSGVEWLGDVPEGWSIILLGSASALIQTGPFGSQLHSYEYIDDGIPVINPSHMKNGRIVPDKSISITPEKSESLQRHKIQSGDIVAARRGEIGRCALVTSVEEGWICGTGSLRICCKPSLYNSSYLLQLLSSQGVKDSLSLSSIGATMDNLNSGMVARLLLPLPSIEEQHQIEELIHETNKKIDMIVTAIYKEIALLHEYRTRLIADVVTGKLDVREAAASLSDEVEEPEVLEDEYDESEENANDEFEEISMDASGD